MWCSCRVCEGGGSSCAFSVCRPASVLTETTFSGCWQTFPTQNVHWMRRWRWPKGVSFNSVRSVIEYRIHEKLGWKLCCGNAGRTDDSCGMFLHRRDPLRAVRWWKLRGSSGWSVLVLPCTCSVLTSCKWGLSLAVIPSQCCAGASTLDKQKRFSCTMSVLCTPWMSFFLFLLFFSLSLLRYTKQSVYFSLSVGFVS